MMERQESLRRTSDETRRVNFAEDPPSGGHHHKELTKKDSFRGTRGEDGSPRQQKKFVSTWKMACDKTRDRTKELLKKWRTMPEGEECRAHSEAEEEHGWTVHVWATWVKRFPSEDDVLGGDRSKLSLSDFQREKLSHCFSHVFDMDRDDIISLQDFESFVERVRHFADWAPNSGEYIVLEQVQEGLAETFILPLRPSDSLSGSSQEALPSFNLNRLFLSLDDWLYYWDELLSGVKSFSQFPVWLQYLPKVLFNAINRSGSGTISRDELSAFYSSVMGFPAQKVGELLDRAYLAMTANGDMKLDYTVYRLCFANLLLGRYPNGPGQYVFGCGTVSPPTFPIDYSRLNSKAEEIEPYSLGRAETNRTSIIV